MWEYNQRKTLIINIILVVLILAIIAGLGLVMIKVRTQTQEHDKELSEIYVQQQQQQTEARQESVTAIQEEYEKDLRTVAEYLPGIVCWGDSLTRGSAGNISFPSVLQAYLDTYFCDIYDFRSTIENSYDFGRLKWDEYKVSVPVVNMGAGSEDCSTVLGRCGAIPYVLKEDIVIPASTEPVEIKLESQEGQSVTPLIGGDIGVNNVVIGGIEGKLSIDAVGYYNYYYHYYFTRTKAGLEMEIPAGTAVKTAATDQYKDYIHVVYLGNYGGYNDANDLVRMTRTLLERQTKNNDRYIVLGPCSSNGSMTNTWMLDSVDTAMVLAFGNRYINVRKYLVEDGLADAGITATKEDQSRIAYKAVPASFTTTNEGVELNGKAYALIGKLVYNRMESLGYFDEVFDELNIKETTKQILKDDPEYFTRMINNALK